MGRRLGNKNIATKRAEATERVRQYRERKLIAAEEEAQLAQDEPAARQRFALERAANNLLYFGEVSPNENCLTVAQEVETARRFARLLGVRDINLGDNQKVYILEVMRTWCSAECPLLDLNTETLSNRKHDAPDPENYIWLDGSDAPFEPASNEAS